MDETLDDIERNLKKLARSGKRFFHRGGKVANETLESSSEFVGTLLQRLDELIDSQERALKDSYSDFFNYVAKQGWTLSDLRDAFNRRVVTAALLGALAVVVPFAPVGQATVPRAPPVTQVNSQAYDPSRTLIARGVLAEATPMEARRELTKVLPTLTHNLQSGEEGTLEQLLTKILSVSVAAELEGNRLNVTYGLIGAEQHLFRYPEDSLAQHASSGGNQTRIQGRGIAPGLGAWGYFAISKAYLTSEAVNREKWYIAAQTFLAPGWNEKANELYAWFKWRKVLVIDPTTGKAVVAVIGDSGPADWTGKGFGGSPELMDVMGLEDGAQKKGVIVLFVNDPENKMPLGPVDIGPIAEGNA